MWGTCTDRAGNVPGQKGTWSTAAAAAQQALFAVWTWCREGVKGSDVERSTCSARELASGQPV